MTTKEIMEIVARNHGQTVEELEREIESCCLGEGKIPMPAEEYIERLSCVAALCFNRDR